MIWKWEKKKIALGLKDIIVERTNGNLRNREFIKTEDGITTVQHTDWQIEPNQKSKIQRQQGAKKDLLKNTETNVF